MTMTIKETAEKMGKSQQFVRVSLQQGLLPFGYAIKMSSRFTYYINRKKFENFIK